VVVYWDLLALWDLAVDYLLLRGTARLAGRSVRRGRLLLAAAAGAAYSVAALALALPVWTLLPAMLLMCAAAFWKTGRWLRLTLLFSLLACSLGGGVLLLGRVCGGMERLVRGVVYARLPWGVFFAAAGLSYLLLTVVFRDGAKRGGGGFVHARVECGGRVVEVRLLRDTGNALADPLTGEGVPVVEEAALAPLFSAYTPFTTLRVHTVGGGDTALRALRCVALTLDGRALGARLIAVAREPFGGAYQGLWYDETGEENAKDELEAIVG